MTTAGEWAESLLLDWPDLKASPAAVSTGDRIADWAECGVVCLTGRPDGPPLVPPGIAATAAKGAELAFRALAQPGTAEVGWHRILGERAVVNGWGRRAPLSVGGTCRAVAVRDGWVALNLARADDLSLIPALLEAEIRPLDQDGTWQVLEAWASRQAQVAVVERAALLGLPCGAIPISDAPADSTDPMIQVIEVSSGFPPARRAAPVVLDLSALWAGPLCAQLLGGAGGEVVKVELAARPDGARQGSAGFYRLINAGHDSIVVDLRTRRDQELLAGLCDRADVVLTSCRPRAWDSLGIDPYDVCRRSPTTWVAITAYGLREGHRVGFGDDVAMSAGLVARESERDPPVPCGDAIADPLTGMHAAVAALAAYRSGGSRILDVSMRAVTAATLGGSRATIAATKTATGWIVPSGSHRHRVRPPVARRVTGDLAELGRDTDRWRWQ